MCVLSTESTWPAWADVLMINVNCQILVIRVLAFITRPVFLTSVVACCGFFLNVQLMQIMMPEVQKWAMREKKRVQNECKTCCN